MVPAPISFLPRVAGESLPRTRSGDEGGGLRPLHFVNTSNFTLSNNGFTRTSNSKGKTLDHHGNESLAIDNFTDVNEIQLGQSNFVDAGHIPLSR
jgi:hypothetical protein